MNAIEELAKSLNVSTIDLMSLMQSVSNSIIQDDMKDKLFQMNEVERQETIEVYTLHAINKHHEFTSKYFTNDAARKVFIDSVKQLF